MASIFTYDPDPPRVSSPWSTSGASSPLPSTAGSRGLTVRARSRDYSDPDSLSDYGITKLEREPQAGPTEYKLHILLRPRRTFISLSTDSHRRSSYRSRGDLSNLDLRPPNSECDQKCTPARVSQSRQQRLHQLTTQLLWRLQQSSPFHSSTAANLILPVLPKATAQLGVPPRPARLLPGLEESQGALYEIGVADDGTFVGLCLDELEESLTNLQAMAFSLGCKVETLRRVIVGECEWAENSDGGDTEGAKYHCEPLWVAEALVSPDLGSYDAHLSNKESLAVFAGNSPAVDGHYSDIEQIRISITGPSTAGKSSLLGTLTSSSFDNGRGKSRLSLLKHRHEISSGITSSVAQELLGYAAGSAAGGAVNVINYASGNVTAWDDIHATSKNGRLAFISDLPGSARYSKSTLRGLISWAPHYIMICIPANSGDDVSLASVGGSAEQATGISLSLSYLRLCFKLEAPILVIITKLDLASKAGMRKNLTKVLSVLKCAGKKPLMLPVSPVSEKAVDLQQISEVDSKEIKRITDETDDWSQTVPIILTSAVDGSGIGKLHAFLRYLPIPQRPALRAVFASEGTPKQYVPANIFDIDEVFAIPPSKVYTKSDEQAPKEGQGVVLCGLVRYGSISIGDELFIGPLSIYPPAEQNNPGIRSRRVEYHSDSPSPGEPLASSARNFMSGKAPLPGRAQWQPVRVVSVRNIRMPFHRLLEDQVGTIGIELISLEGGEHHELGRIRKGMILASFHVLGASVPRPLLFHTGFIAAFPLSEFSSSVAPPLLLGGNAIVYVSNIRAIVKVACVILADKVFSTPPSPIEPGAFEFDDDGSEEERGTDYGAERTASSSDHLEQDDVRITFSFITSIEWIEIGLPLLLIPGASMTRSIPASGLEGLMGRVCQVFSGEESAGK